jgi:hypothetical protein
MSVLPCAGDDWSTFLEFFGDHVDEFHFCDIGGQYEDLGILKSTSPFADAPYLRGPEPNKALYCSFKSFLVMQ